MFVVTKKIHGVSKNACIFSYNFDACQPIFWPTYTYKKNYKKRKCTVHSWCVSRTVDIL